MSEESIQMVSKKVRWTAKVGAISPGLPGIPAGDKYYWAYQLTSGGNKHSGGAGKHGGRFYQKGPSKPVKRG